MSPLLSNEQANALDAVRDWFSNSTKQVFRFYGYAGVGKTTVARELGLGKLGEVLYLAPTNKAASVLAAKGCNPSLTVHQGLYTPRVDASLMAEYTRLVELQDADDPSPALAAMIRRLELLISKMKPEFDVNPDNIVKGMDLVIVDEASMVGSDMAIDLLDNARRLIVLGDPAQLPPVEGPSALMLEPPDVELTQIHRQAAGSPVLELATAIRTGRLHDCPTEPRASALVSSDIVICWKNSTRHWLNTELRAIRGFSGPKAQIGETLVAQRTFRNKKRGCALAGAGTLWRVDAIRTDPKSPDSTHYCLSLVGQPAVKTEAWVPDATLRGAPLPVRCQAWMGHFEFGYAITCHKSQGSQWGKVAIVDEFPEDDEVMYRRWLYTAVTRAEREVVFMVFIDK